MPRKKSSKEKGRVLEILAAGLYDQPGVKVERNVRLPARHTDGKRKRTREIDILIQGTIAGIAIHIPVECKNHRRPIGVQEIGVFIDKIDQVGLAVRHSIFISASGFTGGALARAREVGMITRVLNEVTRANASELVSNALQTRVFLLPVIEQLVICDDIADYKAITETPRDAFFAYAFFNTQGEFVGTILDLIRRMWLGGEVPALIGLHPIKVEIPDDWHRYVQDHEEPIHEIRATIKIVGLLVAVPGTARAHVLFDPETKQVDRGRLEAAFSGPQSTLPVMTFSSEESLTEHLKKHDEAELLVSISRFRLPRLLGQSGYWPPSQKAIAQIKKIVKEHSGMPTDVTAADIEGNLLDAVWDPVDPDYPVFD
jgi:CBS domain-containing protein